MSGYQTLSLGLVGFVLGISWLYRWALPKPIPGIPYNKHAASRLLGDLPDMQAYRSRGLSFRPWLGEIGRRHNSPVVQIFIAPFLKPYIVLNDFWESYDIMYRRTKEFDRSKRNADTFGAIVPEHHISMTSFDPRFKSNKELVKDLMTPGFLHNVVAPSLYNNAQTLVKLWQCKGEKAAGRPFDAKRDLNATALDTLWTAAFGFSAGPCALPAYINAVKQACVQLPANKDEAVVFPTITLSEGMSCLVGSIGLLDRILGSPWPKLKMRLIATFTSARGLLKRQRIFLSSTIIKCAERIEAQQGEVKAQCSMDYMVLREKNAAIKAGRQPIYDSARMRDELLGYMATGHETTATTMNWIVKFLSDNEAQQSILRDHLYSVFAAARAENRQPTVEEIITTPAPYLDAFVEEGLRYQHSVQINLRESIVDTVVLGHPVPKGTTIFMYTRGPSYLSPAFHVDESLRSKSSNDAKKRVGEWDEETIEQFEPLRWLKPKKDVASVGDLEFAPSFSGYDFDQQAGPTMPFGAGPRICFGRRFAYLSLRMYVAMIVWNLELSPCPTDLNSYDVLDGAVSQPRQCYVRVHSANQSS